MSLLARRERRDIGVFPWVNGETVPTNWQSPTGTDRLDQDNALRVAAVWACVRIISDALAAAPLDLYRKEGAVRVPLPSPPALMTPAPGMTPHDWKFAVTASLLLCGNAYAVKSDLDQRGYPRQLPLLQPDRVKPISADGRTITSYKVDRVDYPADLILHIKGFTLPGRLTGISPLEQFGQTIGMGAQAEKFGYRFFSEGATPSGILYSDDPLTQEQSDDLRNTTDRAWRGRRRLAVLGSGLRYEKVSVAPNESQFLETQHFSIEQICSIFGVPPEMIGHAVSGQNVTYANVEQRQLAFAAWTLLPWAARVEDALTMAFPRPQFAKFNLDALVRVDLLTRYTAHGMALKDGWANPNERRAYEDLGTIPKGDVYLWPDIGRRTTVTAPAPNQDVQT